MPNLPTSVRAEPAQLNRSAWAGPLIRKLESFATLSVMERGALVTAISRYRSHEIKHFRALTAPREGVIVIVSGLACRYGLSVNSHRQIFGYLVPGDICGPHMPSLAGPDQCVGTFGPSKTAVLSLSQIMSDLERYPNLTRALLWSKLVEESTTRAWVANMGHRTAFEQVAHLFCELYLRLERVGLTHGCACELRLTQRDLCDALALSAVHVNRILMQLRGSGLLCFRNGQLFVPDLNALQLAAGFDSAYLFGQA